MQSASRRRRHESKRSVDVVLVGCRARLLGPTCAQFSFQVERDGTTSSGHNEGGEPQRTVTPGGADWADPRSQFLQVSVRVCADQNLNARFKFRLRPRGYLSWV